MKINTLCLILSLFACALGQSVTVEVHQGSSPWWLALAPSDSSTTGFSIKDSGSVSVWTALTSTTWGYWTYQPSGVALVPPLSVRLTKGNSVITVNNLITSISAGRYDTASTYSASPSTSAPTTQAPATPSPATNAPSTPAPSTQAPATPSPATNAPSTSAPSTSNPINVQIHSSSSAYWFAVSISGGSSPATSVSLKDAGSYSSYTALSTTSYGYFVFQGNALTLPVSLLVTSGAGSVELSRVVTSFAGATINTGRQYGSSNPSTQAPSTQAPSTPAPATQAPSTQAPATPAPATRPPATPAPSTQAPSTQAPATQAPSTQAPATSTPKPPSGATTAPTGGNPFTGVQFFINSKYVAQVDESKAQYPAWAARMEKVKSYPSSFWLDTISAISKLTPLMNSAQQQQAASGKTVLVSLVIYDLPNRDCAAYASNGELSCEGDPLCVSGLNKYKTQYIDVIYNILKNYPNQRIVAVVEPDSLPNLATNLGVPKCTASVTAYKSGVAYAINKLSQLPNVYLYVDAAHGGWLGWDTGRTAAVAVFKEVLIAAGGYNKIRGFSTNVANYQPLGSMTYTADPCGLATQWNFGTCEVKYVDQFQKSLQAVGINGMHFIIDTGRNGNTAARKDCTQWCNIKNAGLGVPPTTDTAASGRSDIDAYWWVKPPGEGDGTSDSSAVRYDIHCGSSESVTPAPEAGVWFSSYFQMLCQYANPAL